MNTIPVTLLTGFLGAGKSTLLSKVLRDPRFSDSAVVVNEFGEVGLDGALVVHSPDQVVEMTTGCLCCTVRGDIRTALLRLHAAAEAGRGPDFARLVVETTGLADPAPVIATLMQDPRLVRRFALAGVVTAVDAATGEATLARHPEAVKQAALADRIVLTKTDLVDGEAAQQALARLRERLRALNPAASPLDVHAADFNLRRLFETPAFDPAARSLDARAWLNAEAYAGDDHGHHHHHHHAHDHHHHHDVRRHGPDIRAFCITLDAPVSTMAFTTALDLMIAEAGPQLLRVKGIVCLAEKPDTPIAIHGVQHIFHDPLILPQWPDEDRRTRLVFITNGLDAQSINRFFDAWGAPSEEAAAQIS
ncbi:MAG: GTP-binding protein [Pseudomonadota bacterium]